MIGLLAGSRWTLPLAPLLPALAILCALALARHQGTLEARLWPPLLALLSFGCGLAVSPQAELPCRSSTRIDSSARVESVRYRVDDVAIQLRVRGGSEIHLRSPIDGAPPLGGEVRIVAEIRPRTSLHNPSPRSLSDRKKPTGCWARLERPLEILHLSPIRRRIHDLRSRLRQHILVHLEPATAGVARALVLGDGGALGYERRKTIASVGLAHLFAVSGLHVALVSGTLVGLLRWLLAGLSSTVDARRWAAGLGVPLTLLHALTAGGSPSAWRAAATAATTWAVVSAGYRPHPVAVTSAAVLALSAGDLAMALRPAFLLSIVATAAILSAPLPAGRLRWLRGAATISARTLVATAPMVWWWFGAVPLIGWLTNIVLLPFGSWVVIPLSHLFAMSAWAPALSGPLGGALEVSVSVLLHACDRLGDLSVGGGLPPLDATQGLVVAIGSVAILAARRLRSRSLIVLLSLFLWGAAETALIAREQPRGRLRVTFVDVGQGDAALLDFPDGRVGLIDTGRGGRHPAVRELGGLLSARRRRRLDLVILTHGHPDHYGGLHALLDRMPIGEIWVNGQLLSEEADSLMETLLNRALNRGTVLRFPSELCGTTANFGGARIDTLWPCPRYEPGRSLNDNSWTVRVRFGDRSFLFTGDLEAEAERELLASGALGPVDVLKVAHHGSRTSSTRQLLGAVRPALAVISSGAGNRYGHPSPEVLERLREVGAELWRTDLRGGLIVSTDGRALSTGH